MKKILLHLLFFLPLSGWAQSGLFDSDTVLVVKLTGDYKSLVNDRADLPKEHPLTLSYSNGNAEIKIPVSTRTRGNFRRKMGDCIYPPILLIFNDARAKENTLFGEQQKLKLVVPCKSDDYVVKEYMAYRIYNLVTPKSFRARLVKLTFEDPDRKKNPEPFYSILLEEESQMARRNNLVSVEKNLNPVLTEPNTFITMAVFEYMIGNTDWSVEYQQNVKLIAQDSLATPFTVPYDFDHSGLVNASYAHPAEQLQLASVTERRYRGYCLTDLNQYSPSFALFNKLKDQVYSLFETAPYLTAGSKKSCLKFIDEFYAAINNPQRVKKDFGYPCDPNGTGEIIIKGLKNEQKK
ncbi:MAG TPA: hypothetical protein VK166_08150 [Chitinophagaceae bacterium]|nr:hypothetical protein [Chitinophagaceae bacterium]